MGNSHVCPKNLPHRDICNCSSYLFEERTGRGVQSTQGVTRFTREVPSALLNPLHREGNATLHRGGGNGNPTLYTHCKLHRESNSTPLCMELERAINIVGQKNAPHLLRIPPMAARVCGGGGKEGFALWKSSRRG